MSQVDDIKIESGIPLPPKSTKGTPKKYPFSKLEVGQSFALPLSGDLGATGRDRTVIRLSASAVAASKRHGSKFSLRTIKDEGVVRVWRVS